MAIIKVTDWTPPDVTPHATVQQLGQTPERTYRQLLMAEDANGSPIPYSFGGAINAGDQAFVRIPHAFSVGAAVGDLTPPATVTPVATGVNDPSRIPDVVIPVLIEDVAHAAGAAVIALVWDAAAGLGADAPSTGMWADENYIYLSIRNPTAAQINRVDFVVYVEYTQSVISNEVVTGTYYYMT